MPNAYRPYRPTAADAGMSFLGGLAERVIADRDHRRALKEQQAAEESKRAYESEQAIAEEERRAKRDKAIRDEEAKATEDKAKQGRRNEAFADFLDSVEKGAQVAPETIPYWSQIAGLPPELVQAVVTAKQQAGEATRKQDILERQTSNPPREPKAEPGLYKSADDAMRDIMARYKDPMTGKFLYDVPKAMALAQRAFTSGVDPELILLQEPDRGAYLSMTPEGRLLKRRQYLDEMKDVTDTPENKKAAADWMIEHPEDTPEQAITYVKDNQKAASIADELARHQINIDRENMRFEGGKLNDILGESKFEEGHLYEMDEVVGLLSRSDMEDDEIAKVFEAYFGANTRQKGPDLQQRLHKAAPGVFGPSKTVTGELKFPPPTPIYNPLLKVPGRESKREP